MKNDANDDYQIELAVIKGGEDVGKIDWVIRDFLARGSLVLLAAEMGSGKTTLIYRAAESIHKGELFLDQLPTKKGRVLVIQGDEPITDARKKFRRMGLETQFEICYVEKPPLNLNWLERQIKSKVYIAILIDSMTSLLAVNTLDVTDLGFVRKLYRLKNAFAVSNVAGLITSHLNKPFDNKIRHQVTKHDIQGVATIGAAVTDALGMWKHPKPEWPEHYNLICLGKRNLKEGTLLKLQGNEEDYHWSLIDVGKGPKPQEKLSLQKKIEDCLVNASKPLPLSDIAERVGTSYEYVRRICTEMYDIGLLTRAKIETGKIGRPTYLYGFK